MPSKLECRLEERWISPMLKPPWPKVSWLPDYFYRGYRIRHLLIQMLPLLPSGLPASTGLWASHKRVSHSACFHLPTSPASNTMDSNQSQSSLLLSNSQDYKKSVRKCSKVLLFICTFERTGQLLESFSLLVKWNKIIAIKIFSNFSKQKKKFQKITSFLYIGRTRVAILAA